MARKASKKSTAPADDPKNVVRGDDHGRDVNEQARLVRGEDEPAKDDGTSKAGVSKSKQAAEANYTDDKKAADLAKEARIEHLESLGIDPNSAGGTNGLKVEPADHNGKLYVGPVTCESIHGQTHEKISWRFELPTPSGEGYLKHCFLQAHPNALVEEKFEIDPTNEKIDPNLRSRYE